MPDRHRRIARRHPACCLDIEGTADFVYLLVGYVAFARQRPQDELQKPLDLTHASAQKQGMAMPYFAPWRGTDLCALCAASRGLDRDFFP